MQDYLAPQPLAVRTCAAAGTKFYDLNANSQRDAGEPGIPRFLIWADYNGDGRREANEPFAVTDEHGRYLLEDIHPPAGEYTLRETLLSPGRQSSTSWVCSYPHAGTPARLPTGPRACSAVAGDRSRPRAHPTRRAVISATGFRHSSQ